MIYSVIILIAIIGIAGTYVITKKKYKFKGESEFNRMLTDIVTESFSNSNLPTVTQQIVKILKSYYKVEYVTILMRDKNGILRIVSTNIKPEHAKQLENYCNKQLRNMDGSIVKLNISEQGTLDNDLDSIRGIQFNLFANLIYDNNLIGAVLIEGTNSKDIEKEKIREDIYSKIFNSTAMVLQNVINTDKLIKMLSTDQLTGVFNRRYMDNKLNEEIERHRINKKTFNVALMDIDFFKKCNDTYGHPYGDLVLQRVSGFIQKNIRKNEFSSRSNDWIARYGGEEFIVIFTESNPKDIYNKINEIREGISNLVIADGDIKSSVTVSFGIATFPFNGTSAERLIEKADAALYESKNTGRNKVTMAK